MGDSLADEDSKAMVKAINPSPNEQQQQQHVLHPNPPSAFEVEASKAPTPPQNPHILVWTNGIPTPIPTDLPTIHETAFWGGMSLGEMLQLARAKALELHLDRVASDIETWIQQHPWKAAFYAASAIAFFAPEIISIPALEALGFGLGGVRAGSMAAKIQSMIGPVAARSVFAIWQSARMGGYGVEYVNGGVKALIDLTDAAVAGCNPLLLKDCKGLISDGGSRSLGLSSATTALVVVCGCVVGLKNLIG
ncbi:MAG: hypothetical protein Q9202_006782 [Teloschistes flavicans]